MKKHKQDGFAHLLIILIVFVLVVAIGVFVFFRVRDNSNTSSAVTKDGKTAGAEAYNWSTMNQGPYKDKVYFVTSNSLLQWSGTGQQLATHSSVPEVIYKDGVLYVYFVDVSQDGIPEQIGLRKSEDNGATWSDKQFITIQGVGNKIAVDPDPFVLPDGRIRLYYFDIATTKTQGLENNTIYSAISNDGINFTQEEGSRFIYPAIFDPDVTYINGTWRMYVGTDDQKVLSATSIDGLTFSYEGVALNDGAIPNVFYENSTYYLFTGGINISTSTDGKTFTKTSNRFDCGGLTADPGVIKLNNDRYLMVYKTN